MKNSIFMSTYPNLFAPAYNSAYGGSKDFSAGTSFYGESQPCVVMDNTYSVVLIIIAIIGLIIAIILNTIFIYRPVARIESKVDQVINRFEQLEPRVSIIATKIESTATTIDNIINEGRQLAADAFLEFEEYKQDICTFIGDIGITPLPGFCTSPTGINSSSNNSSPFFFGRGTSCRNNNTTTGDRRFF